MWGFFGPERQQIMFIRSVVRLLAAVYAKRQFGRPERNVMPEFAETQGSRRAGTAGIVHTTADPSRSRDCTDEHQDYGSHWQSLPFVTHTHSGEVQP